jgi:hypothetical protein
MEIQEDSLIGLLKDILKNNPDFKIASDYVFSPNEKTGGYSSSGYSYSFVLRDEALREEVEKLFDEQAKYDYAEMCKKYPKNKAQ